jgi:hypothetical protein
VLAVRGHHLRMQPPGPVQATGQPGRANALPLVPSHAEALHPSTTLLGIFHKVADELAQPIGVVGTQLASEQGAVGRVDDEAGLSAQAVLRGKFRAVALFAVDFDECQPVRILSFEFRPDRAESVAGRSPLRVNEVDSRKLFRIWNDRCGSCHARRQRRRGVGARRLTAASAGN